MRRPLARGVLVGAAQHGHPQLVLGAWGCGVFGNDPGEIAALFAEAIRGQFDSAFERVVFAVLDASDDGRTILPFLERFSASAGNAR